MSELPLTWTIYSISIVISYVIFSSSEQKNKMIPYVTCRVPLRVSAPTVIPVCDHWNRGKMEVLSAQDGWTQIQGQTNIRPLPRLINILSFVERVEVWCATTEWCGEDSTIDLDSTLWRKGRMAEWRQPAGVGHPPTPSSCWWMEIVRHTCFSGASLDPMLTFADQRSD